MQETPPVQTAPVRILAALFASAGLALVVTCGFAFLACHGGLLFSGLDVFVVVQVAVGLTAIVIPVTAWIFRRKKKHFGWRALCIVVMLLALVAVATMSWLQTRQHLRIFMNPVPVPSGVHVHRGRSIMFSSYVHFTAPPAVIAKLVQLKELVETPDDLETAVEHPGYSELQRTKAPWDWWQPATMAKPKFFFRHHQSEAVQGWAEGWWINGTTNEVYAYIGG